MFKIISKYPLALALLWTLVIFGLCCMPGRYIPTTNWLELLSFDKFVHASIFFVLVCLWLAFAVVKHNGGNGVMGLIILSCILYGGALEIMQATVFSQRSADWFDFIANSVGCLAGALFFSKKKHLLQIP